RAVCALVWTPPCGPEWARVRLPRRMDRAGGVFDIAANDEGYVAATAQGPWRSRDGRRWTRASLDSIAGVVPLEVESVEDGFIGLGIDDAAASVWVAG